MQLNPGRYSLHVRATNNHGVQSPDKVLLLVKVLPPIWKTWWAKTLAAALMVLVFVLFYQVQTRRIRERNRTLMMEIVRRQQIELQLEAKTQELEIKNTELEMFGYTISHEVRTPLFTLEGFLGLLEQDLEAEDREGVRRDLAQIRSAAGMIRRLLDELQELWRYGRSSEELDSVPLAVLIDEAVELTGRRLDQGGVEVKIETGLPLVLGDRHRLGEVFRILIENAARFMGTQESPRIRVGVRFDGDDPVVFVEDNGAGIAARYHEKVFQLFEQLDPACEGTGMGLALARRIVETHSGRIWVESDGPDCGSTFCITLPLEIGYDDVEVLAESQPGIPTKDTNER